MISDSSKRPPTHDTRVWLTWACLGSIAFVLAAAAVFVRAAASRGDGIPVYCDSPLFDFGNSKAGQELRHAFRIENNSTFDVVEMFVVAGCSACSAAQLDRDSLPAGELATVEVLVDVPADSEEIYREFLLYWRPAGRTEFEKMVLAVKSTVSS